MEIREVFVDQVDVDENNPRRDMGDLAALAATFDAGPYPGEPINPIVVAADGDRYRIVDGERRFRAMRDERRLTRFHAVVCEDVDDVAAASAMVASDDKLALSDLEKSRGVQQMLMLGVQPSVVDRVSGRSGARYVRAAMADSEYSRTRQLSLDHLERIGELMSLGRAADARSLEEADPSDWQRVADKLDRGEKVREGVQTANAELNRLHLPHADVGSADPVPDGAAGMTYLAGCYPGEVAETVRSAGLEVGFAVVRADEWNTRGCRVSLYGAAEDQPAEVDGHAEEVDAMSEALGRWLDWAEPEMLGFAASKAPDLPSLAERMSRHSNGGSMWDSNHERALEWIDGNAPAGCVAFAVGAIDAVYFIMRRVSTVRENARLIARAIVDPSSRTWAWTRLVDLVDDLEALCDDGLDARFPDDGIRATSDAIDSAINARISDDRE